MLAVFIFLQLDRKKGDITANDYDIVLCTNEMQDALFNYRNLLKNNYPSEETCEELCHVCTVTGAPMS
uniref:Uncharacterized protein n=1 Tax=Magallana gigas TaxID=29159 RepID=K1R2T1_MAGGI